MPLVMSTGTMALGLYLALAGGSEFAAFGWLMFALGLVGVLARLLLPVRTRAEAARTGSRVTLPRSDPAP